MAEADPEDGQAARVPTQKFGHHARLVRMPRAGREREEREFPGGEAFFDTLEGGVVAPDLDRGPLGAERLPEVVGEGVVVVEEEHVGGCGHGASPAGAARASRTARALWRVSSASSCGSESATTPAPACTVARPRATSAERITMAVSMSPAAVR